MSDAGDSDAILATVAFLAVFISSVLGFGIWMAHRTAKEYSARNTAYKHRPLRAVRRNRIHDTSTMELGNAFMKSYSSDLASSIYSYSDCDNLASYLPTPPQPVYVAGGIVFPPSGLPFCHSLDAAKSPTMVVNSMRDLCGVETVYGDAGSKTTYPLVQNRTQLLPSGDLIDFGEDTTEEPIFHRTSGVGLGLIFDDAKATEDDETTGQGAISEADHRNLQRESSVKKSLSDGEGPSLASLQSLLKLAHPEASPIASSLPTLLVTSASLTRGVGGHLNATLQLPSPPATPTLVLTSPSINYGLDPTIKGQNHWNTDDGLENWSDVLSLDDYETNESLSLDDMSMRLLDEFPSPPDSPTSNTRRSTRTASQFGYIHSDEQLMFVGGGSNIISRHACDKQVTINDRGGKEGVPFDYEAFRKRLSTFNRDQEQVKMEALYVAEGSNWITRFMYDEQVPGDQKEDPPFDYEAFRKRLSAFNREQEHIRVASTLTVEDTRNLPVTTSAKTSETPSCSTDFDYGKLLARKRSSTIVNDIPTSLRHAPFPVMRTAPRPRPLPIEVQPLLTRNIERSGFRSFF